MAASSHITSYYYEEEDKLHGTGATSSAARWEMRMDKPSIMHLSRCIIEGDNQTRLAILHDIANRAVNTAGLTGRGWRKAAKKLIRFVESGTPTLSVYVEGNSKLPFNTFSTFPVLTCPGSGACSEYCYSLKALSHPDAWARFIQNTLLLLTTEGRATVAGLLPTGILRLYVDGDFDSLETLSFWMEVLRSRPDVRAYGYSKSLPMFLAYTGQVPANYMLNLSTGGKFDSLNAGALAWPFVRGRFITVPTRKPSEARAIMAEQWPGKSFKCPGFCGNCLHGQHACGNEKLKGINIYLPIH